MILFGIELFVIFKFVYLSFSLSFIKDDRIKLNSIPNNAIIVQYIRNDKILL